MFEANGSIKSGHYADLSDRDLVFEVAARVRGAAILSRFCYGLNVDDEACRELFAEADRRGKPQLYERGYENAWREE